MLLYSHSFDLLPRPDRSIFSLGNESTRATIPDFESVEQLRDFTRRIVVLKLEVPTIFIQVKIGCAFMVLLVLLFILIFARRIHQRSFWIIRLVRRPEGTVLIPNAILAFSLLEAIFSILFVAFLFRVIYVFEKHTLEPWHSYLWQILPPLPLIFGAIWSAWGTFFAIPNALQAVMDAGRDSRIRRILLRPSIINWSGLLVPLFASLTIVIPAVFADIHSQRGARLLIRWQDTYSTETEFSQEMVQATQVIWFESLKAANLTAIVYALWTISAILAGVGYALISWGLISAIQEELYKNRDLLTLEKSQSHQHHLPSEQRGEGNRFFTSTELERNSPCSAFFPPVLPQQIVGSTSTSTVQHPSLASRTSIFSPAPLKVNTAPTSTAHSTNSQRTFLSATLRHTYIHLFAISPACLALGSLALFMAMTIHSQLEQPSKSGGNRWEYYGAIALSIYIWIVCLAGGIVVFAIALRTYEPILAFKVVTPRRLKQYSSSTLQKKGVIPIPSPIFESHSRQYPRNSARPDRDEQCRENQANEDNEMRDMNRNGNNRGFIFDQLVTYEEEKDTSTYNRPLSYSGDNDVYFIGSAGRSQSTSYSPL